MLPGQLELFPMERIPWQGVSPRALTRGYNVVILTARAEGHEVDLNQGDLFRDPWRRALDRRCPEGAPPLLPLPWERRRGSDWRLS